MTGQAQLTRLRADLDAADARASALAARCAPEAWTRRASDGGWSPSECLQHVVISVDAMLLRMDAAIADGQARGVTGPGPFSPGLLGRVLLWVIEPPYRLSKTRTGAAFVPAAPRDPQQDVTAMVAAHDRVRRSLDGAAGLALDRLSIVSPFDPRVSYNLYTAFAILPVHARRHLWQAERAVTDDR